MRRRRGPTAIGGRASLRRTFAEIVEPILSWSRVGGRYCGFGSMRSRRLSRTRSVLGWVSCEERLLTSVVRMPAQSVLRDLHSEGRAGGGGSHPTTTGPPGRVRRGEGGFGGLGPRCGWPVEGGSRFRFVDLCPTLTRGSRREKFGGRPPRCVGGASSHRWQIGGGSALSSP